MNFAINVENILYRQKKNLAQVLGVFAVAFFLMMYFMAGAKAANSGDYLNFNVDQNYDAIARSKIQATLVKTTPSLYFYVETAWWEVQPLAKKNEILNDLDNVSSEFKNNIYPTLTSVFGSEWNPGVDGDTRITILFQSIKENLGGYFRSTDGYIKLQAPDSNEREMLYLPIAKIEDPQLKGFLAHEFVHLITFNQKDRLQNVQEEIWLNEARADYASTILGYDNNYEGSNLQRRVRDFLERPSDSLTEWQNTKYDYASESLFMHYLVDHYGINILADSLKLKSVGIESINEILLKNGYQEDFGQIFTDWTVSVVINDCFLNSKYCYFNENLNNIKINPTLNFLPLTGNSSLSVTNVTKNWAGNWQKVIGGNGDLTLEFASLAGLDFKVPYILYDKKNNYTIAFLQLDSQQKGEITIKDFGTNYKYLIINPSLQTKTAGFDGLELTYPYTFTVSIAGDIPGGDPVTIQNLLNQIADLKKKIAAIQNNTNVPPVTGCTSFPNNLYAGYGDVVGIKCLQQFLASQGSGIYPEALVTGNFGILTKAAVVRFQEKYKEEILSPVGLLSGTGYVGVFTRQKINQLLQT
ncbi:MAG: hypothetical protein A2908_03985 [Candidatus Staskawiczbacteria bacterium RIFCSPLOWO2_01_FULL_38_12b]|uniref:Peptidoglycan binding-like domain-containing protein n=1 Tax=Candidatus Staskawiczbacteria bacterium RIFCSPLOWO2_01_FULL_38_12b TaxID=1802214 RepID=A0A1G2IBY5_9BACT|nr:MAG: hypothetical protein A2908_03985 [Candidatus Staskawiczbacteria bacterium RIFCSPLOWO2_01_FULL_38_12b]